MNQPNQRKAWSKELCEELIATKKAIENLKNNSDFKFFLDFYINKHRRDLLKDLGTHILGYPDRQIAMELLIGIGNLEYFLDEKIDNDGELAKTYLDEYNQEGK